VLESYSEQPADERIPLHGGLPHPDAFPISQLSVKLKSGASLTIDKVDLASQNVQYLIRLHVKSLYEFIGLALPAGNRCTAVCYTSAGTLIAAQAVLNQLQPLVQVT